MKSLYWKLHLKSPPDKVFDLLTSDQGREKFWAEKSVANENKFELTFPNGETTEVFVVEEKNHTFEFIYFRTIVIISLVGDEDNGTDLVLNNKNIPADDYDMMASGWVSVLMALKAAADYDIDLRNHDSSRTWDEGYVDN